jgi:hypothetical protein
MTSFSFVWYGLYHEEILIETIDAWHPLTSDQVTGLLLPLPIFLHLEVRIMGLCNNFAAMLLNFNVEQHGPDEIHPNQLIIGSL